MSDNPTSRTITLTNRLPVTIVEDDWPMLAAGVVAAQGWAWHEMNRQYFWSNAPGRMTDVRVVIRQHADGRGLVYGIWEYTHPTLEGMSRKERAGFYVEAPEQLIEALIRLKDELIANSHDPDNVGNAVRQCLANLPAEVL